MMRLPSVFILCGILAAGFVGCSGPTLAVQQAAVSEDRAVTLSTLYTPLSTDPNPGSLYARAMQLKNQTTASNNGKMYATFEQYKSGTPVFPIYESTDSGQTWTQVGSVTDQVNGWGMRYQPFLYELPQAIGNLAKGTLLCAGNSIPGDLSLTKIDLYASTNLGRTWSFVSSIASGGRADPNGSYDPVWEPFLLVANNKLICYYTDETDPAHNQKMVHKTSTNGTSWGAAVNDVALGTSLRPGMPVVAQLANGNYIMTFEIIGLSGAPCNYKISSDPESWSPATQGTTFGYGGSPYVTVMPSGKVVLGTYGTGNVYVNANNMSGGIASIATALSASYTRALVPLSNGRLFIIGGGPIGGSSSTNRVTYCDQDIGTSMVTPNRFQSYNVAGSYWRHYDYLARIDSSISPIEDSQFRVVPGLADASAISFESLNFPGYYVRHYNYQLRVDRNNDTAVFKSDATFRQVTGFSSASAYSYQSYNFPTRYIRHLNSLLRIDPISTDAERQSATFYRQ